MTTNFPPNILTVWPATMQGAAMEMLGITDIASPIAEAVGDKDMLSAYQTSALVASHTIERHEAAAAGALVRVKKDARPHVLVADGKYDQMNAVLEASEIPHIRLGKTYGEHLPQVLDMDRHRWIKALLVNCACDIPGDARPRIASFVEEGGLLMTSDWALRDLIEKLFPEKIGHSGISTEQLKHADESGKEFVDVELGNTKSPSLIAAFEAARKAGIPVRWWLEPSSHVIAIKDTGAVKVLLRSSELQRRYGSDVIQAAFQHDLGLVVHQISHVNLQHTMSSGAQKPDALVRFADGLDVSADVFSGGGQSTANPLAVGAATVSTLAFLLPLLRVLGKGEEIATPIIMPQGGRGA